TWTRAPAGGTLPPSHVAGLDHGPFWVDRTREESFPGFYAALSLELVFPRAGRMTAAMRVSACNTAAVCVRRVVPVSMLPPGRRSARWPVRSPQHFQGKDESDQLLIGRWSSNRYNRVTAMTTGSAIT